MGEGGERCGKMQWVGGVGGKAQPAPGAPASSWADRTKVVKCKVRAQNPDGAKAEVVRAIYLRER